MEKEMVISIESDLLEKARDRWGEDAIVIKNDKYEWLKRLCRAYGYVQVGKITQLERILNESLDGCVVELAEYKYDVIVPKDKYR